MYQRDMSKKPRTALPSTSHTSMHPSLVRQPMHEKQSPMPDTPTSATRRIPLFPPFPSTEQMRMSEPGDSTERQAEQITEQIMRMPTFSPDELSPAPGSIQIPRAPHRQAIHPMVNIPLLKSRISPVSNLASGETGQPLDLATRAFMEPRFGVKLGQVRIHIGEQAAHAANALSARAYTLGKHIVFGRGEYVPGTRAGQRLLAHELAHVVSPSPHPLIQRMLKWKGAQGRDDEEEDERRRKKREDEWQKKKPEEFILRLSSSDEDEEDDKEEKKKPEEFILRLSSSSEDEENNKEEKKPETRPSVSRTSQPRTPQPLTPQRRHVTPVRSTARFSRGALMAQAMKLQQESGRKEPFTEREVLASMRSPVPRPQASPYTMPGTPNSLAKRKRSPKSSGTPQSPQYRPVARTTGIPRTPVSPTAPTTRSTQGSPDSPSSDSPPHKYTKRGSPSSGVKRSSPPRYQWVPKSTQPQSNVSADSSRTSPLSRPQATGLTSPLPRPQASLLTSPQPSSQNRTPINPFIATRSTPETQPKARASTLASPFSPFQASLQAQQSRTLTSNVARRSPPRYVPPPKDNDPFLPYVASWYRDLHPGHNVSSNHHQIENAAVPPRNLPASQWSQYHDTGYGKAGIPDIINRTQKTIWEVKTGGGYEASMGTSWPSGDTRQYGQAQADWYVTRANKTQFDGHDEWRTGTFTHIPNAESEYKVTFKDDTILIVQLPSDVDSVITYKVIRKGSSGGGDTEIVRNEPNRQHSFWRKPKPREWREKK